VSKSDILAGLHEAISSRVVGLLTTVGIKDKFVIAGDIGKNAGVVTKIGEKLDEDHGAARAPDCWSRGSSPARTRPGHEKGHCRDSTGDSDKARLDPELPHVAMLLAKSKLLLFDFNSSGPGPP
jgi:hypothetical protein